MLDHEIIPRLLALSGEDAKVRLKRFQSFGLGESRVDDMLSGVESRAAGGAVKLGFQAHYPQLETKLFLRGGPDDDLEAMMAPVEAAVRERLGSQLLSEDDATLEQFIRAAMAAKGATLAIAGNVDWREDPDTAFPRYYSGKLEARLKDGRVLAHREAVNRGSDANPLTAGDIEAKFWSNAERAVSRKKAGAVYDAVMTLDSAEDAWSLARALSFWS